MYKGISGYEYRFTVRDQQKLMYFCPWSASFEVLCLLEFDQAVQTYRLPNRLEVLGWVRSLVETLQALEEGVVRQHLASVAEVEHQRLALVGEEVHRRWAFPELEEDRQH